MYSLCSYGCLLQQIPTQKMYATRTDQIEIHRINMFNLFFSWAVISVASQQSPSRKRKGQTSATMIPYIIFLVAHWLRCLLSFIVCIQSSNKHEDPSCFCHGPNYPNYFYTPHVASQSVYLSITLTLELFPTQWSYWSVLIMSLYRERERERAVWINMNCLLYFK